MILRDTRTAAEIFPRDCSRLCMLKGLDILFLEDDLTAIYRFVDVASALLAGATSGCVHAASVSPGSDELLFSFDEITLART